LLLEGQRREIEVDCRRPHAGFSAEDDAARADSKPGKFNPEDVRVLVVIRV